MSKKLLLFDIDGTLIHGRGIPKKVFMEMIVNRFPQFTDGVDIKFSGMTDPLIVRKIFEANGAAGILTEALMRELLDAFAENLARVVHKKNPPQVLPGVPEILDFCSADPTCKLGLVTGNIMTGARIKLQAAGLYHHFALGAFGSDFEDRNQLPPLAVKRAERYFGTIFKKENTWIIGDSRRDVECARVNGLRSLAVASGLTESDELLKENPDFITDSLEDLNHLKTIIQL